MISYVLFLVGTDLHSQLNFGTAWRPFFPILIETNQLFSLTLLKCFCDVFALGKYNIITGVLAVGGGRAEKSYSINSENLLL